MVVHTYNSSYMGEAEEGELQSETRQGEKARGVARSSGGSRARSHG
jgi:hypothetical protein